MAVAAASVFNLPSFPKEVSGVIFLSALSVAGADTLASEIGVLSRKAYLITTFKRVSPGTDGGISALGQLCAVGAAFYTAVVGYFVLSYLARAYGLEPSMPEAASYLVIPAVIGFVGCQIDSVIGATLERKGLVSKRGTNLIATSLGAILSIALLAAW
jgi:uncharacterized protein (TIGR00297 family)